MSFWLYDSENVDFHIIEMPIKDLHIKISLFAARIVCKTEDYTKIV